MKLSFSNAYGIDLGTDRVKLYRQNGNLMQGEKNMIAMRDGTQVLAVGDAAYEMFEKAPENVSVERSFKSARIADVAKVEYILHTLLRRLDAHLPYAPLLFFAAPENMSEMEKRAYYAMSHAGKLNHPRVYLVDRSICDAIALGVPLTRTKGTMIVNLGAESTEVTVLANEQAMITRQIPIGGEQLHLAICDAVRRNQHLMIGTKTAELLKNSLATLAKRTEERSMIVYGISTLTGLPAQDTVTQAEIRQAIVPLFHSLADELASFLSRIPPQMGSLVTAEGIYISGGLARIPQIELFLQERLDCPIRLSYDFEHCTIHGLREIIGHKALHRYAYKIGKRT